MIVFWFGAASAATFAVGGSGPYATIGAAVSAANDGDTLEVAPGAWAEALDLGGKDLVIRSTGGSGVTFLAPATAADVFTLTRGERATLEGFTITPSGGRAVVVDGGTFTGTDLVVQGAGALGVAGGGLSVEDAVATLRDVSFSGGAATWGGQLHAGLGAVVTGTNLVFSGGTATYGGALHVSGGATVTLTTVLATDITSTRDGGFAHVDGGTLELVYLSLDVALATGGDGGGFYVTGHGALTLDTAMVTGATADLGGAIFADDSAGVVLVDVSLVNATGGAVALDGATFDGLRLVISGAVADEGAAVAARGGTTGSCEACLFEGNVATNDGGALLLGSGSSWDDVDGTWQDNESGGAGGAAVLEGAATARFDGAVFVANTARSDGGAIAAAGSGALILIDVSFLNDRSATGSGGAVWCQGPLSIEGGTFDSNVATLGGGGAVAADDTLDVDGARFVANSADDDGGAIQVTGARLTVREATFFRNDARGDGGAVHADAVDTVTLSRGYFHGNTGRSGGAIRIATPRVSATLTNLRVTDNTATDGGGLHVDGVVQVSVENCTFAGNDATDDGGHVYAGGPVRLVNDLFTQAVDGGGVWGLSGTGSDHFYDLVWDDAGGGWAGAFADPTGTSGNLSLDPRLVAYSADGDETDDDLSLAVGSPALDAGSPAIFDVDGTRSDIGAFGGPDADVQDGDRDGWFDNVDCDDGDAAVYPGAPEVAYDAIDQDCSGGDLDDVDGDGFGRVSGGDCDDDEASVFPGALEVWYDGVDADCSGGSDYDYDGDRHDAIVGGGDDCDDADPTVYGTRPETWYDGIDADCDGRSDYDRDRDGHDASAYGGADCDDLSAARFPGNTELPYDTIDQDCSGADLVDVDGDGWVGEPAGGTDCNDGDPRAFPGAYEDPSDGQDTDCDGLSEWDRDGDGYQNELGAGDDCDDTDAAVNPGAVELWYDGVDDDCDGRDDDQDGDGWLVAEDCDDTDPAVHPGAIERENGLDDDCDGWAETDDRDGDGLTDLAEWGFGTDPANPDTDGDTLSDGIEITDRDEDQLLDALDEDDDGDGIPTRTEQTYDLDDDGTYDVDADEDGTINAWDLDSDDDSYLDRTEGTDDLDQDGAPDFLDYQGDLVGGGCGGGWAGVLLLGGLGGLLRRRAGAAVVAMSVSGPALAVDAHGFQLGATTGDPNCYTRLGCPDVGASGQWDAGVVFDYADDPLAETLPDGRVPVLDALATANVTGAWSFGGLQVDAVIPVHLFGVDSSGGFSALGDIRLGAQVPWKRDGWPTIALRTAVWAPTGSEAHWVGSTSPRAMVAGTIGEDFGRLGVFAMAGVMVAVPSQTRNLSEGFGPMGGVGVSFRATDTLSAALEFSTASDLLLGPTAQLPIEASLSARARLPMGAWATLGAAAGMDDGVGASRWRAFVGVGFSKLPPPPPPPAVYVDPLADRDGDGFPDVSDDCPDQAETVDGFTDDDGCPELDGDGDGVAFDKDVCPREPIRPEQDPRYSDGCPKVAELAGDRIVITETIYFKEARAELLPGSERVLGAVAGVLLEHPEIPYVLIGGHTNLNGSDAFNIRLSDARAFSVMRWLVDHGVPYERLLSKGFGEARPLVAGETPDALAINRRVEFRIVRIEDLPADARRIEAVAGR
ncbi:MAG: MopE-related protein [Myxococcota bacterium]